MKRSCRLLSLGLTLSLVPLLLAGCGGSRFANRAQVAADVITIQMQPQQSQVEMPQQEYAPQAASEAENAATPTVTQPARTAPSQTAANDSLDELMDDLETALNELDGAISAADQDALSDSTLASLGK